jgi:hypothetical protein
MKFRIFQDPHKTDYAPFQYSIERFGL